MAVTMFVPSASDAVANVAEPELPRFMVLNSVAGPQGLLCPSGVNTGRRPVREAAAAGNAANRVPTSSDPRQKLTLPSGEPVGAGLTVAVNVTVCPTPAGFGFAASVVVVPVKEEIVIGTLFESASLKPAFPE